MVDDQNEWIRQRAYELWESEERPQGEDIRHWMQAEDEFSSRKPGADSSGPTEVPTIDITTGERPAGDTVRETEGP